MDPKIKIGVQILSNGTVNLYRGRKRVAFITPEIFTEGWAKNVPSARLKAPRRGGVIPLPGQGRLGLKTSATPVRSGFRFRFVLTALEMVKVIHVRLVVNLPYKDWLGCGYRLGRKAGRFPAKTPANNRLAEAQEARLTMGPSKGVVWGMKAPGLYTVLQDNRQWTPYLHAFVNRHEPNDPAWAWKAGGKKVYAFTLMFTDKP
jgi:hypothetical protein